MAIVASTVAGIAVGSSGWTKTGWKIRDLGRLRGLAMAPVAVNERGEIVGYGYGSSVAGRAFLWGRGKLIDLGACGGYSRAVAINARGQAVGSCGLRPGGKANHAFLWRGAIPVDLGTLGWTSSEATAVNDRGQVVGNIFRHNEEHAFLWQGGKMRDLGTLGGARSEATAVNDRGEVAGDSTTVTGQKHAFFWRDGKMADLGTLDGSASRPFGGVANEQFQPTAINNAGQIVGLAHDPIGSYETAFLWQKGQLTSFGRFAGQPNRAVAINDRGQVLLQTTPPSDKRGDAYLWQNGKLAKLPSFDPDQPATFASALNDHGEVVGRSLVAVGHMRPFAWSSGRMRMLPTLGGGTGAPFPSVTTVNDRGLIVGSSALRLVIWTRRNGS